MKTNLKPIYFEGGEVYYLLRELREVMGKSTDKGRNSYAQYPHLKDLEHELTNIKISEDSD